MSSLSANPDPEDPVLKLDAKGILEFIDAQNRREREYFDRLLKWLAAVLAVILAVFTFFGYQNMSEVRKVGDQIREDTKKQLSIAVSEELTKEKIQDEIGRALQQKTDAQFQEAINKSVGAELNTPQRQKILEAATKRQVDAVTKRLQDRERILKLGDNAIGQGPTSAPALAELRKLVKIDPDDTNRADVQGEIAKVMSFWGGGATYLNSDYQITSLNGKPVKESALTTCDLLIALRSSFWKDRARSAQLLANRGEKGVPEALVSAAADPYLDVATHAIFALRSSARRWFGAATLPEVDELRKWWAQEGQSITANFKPLECK